MGFLFTNWKTSVTGLIVIILTTAGPVLDHYHPLVGMSWTITFATIAGVVTGTGLLAAKDSTTHSTTQQSAASEATVLGNPNAPAMVKKADDQVTQSLSK